MSDIDRKTEQWKYNEKLFWHDIKWGLRFLLVIAFLIALKYFAER